MNLADSILTEKTLVFLGLGSNLGNRYNFLEQALKHISDKYLACSRIFETEPYGDIVQPSFLNLVAAFETNEPCVDLLIRLKQIEVLLGRKKREHWGPREVDIDILLFGTQLIHNEFLTVPHKDMLNRMFVMAPLNDIAPDLILPVTGKSVHTHFLELGTTQMQPVVYSSFIHDEKNKIAWT